MAWIPPEPYGQPPERTEHTQPLLYNLHDDPSERFDVAAAHPAIVADLQKRIARHVSSFAIADPLLDLRLEAARAR